MVTARLAEIALFPVHYSAFYVVRRSAFFADWLWVCRVHHFSFHGNLPFQGRLYHTRYDCVNTPDKMIAESEIVVSVAVKCLQQALNRGNFGYVLTESEKTKTNREEYKTLNDSLAVFVKHCCVVGEGKTPASDFKKSYLEWCRDNKKYPESTHGIGRILQKEHGVEKFKSNVDCYRLTIKYV